ncbi:hypothetical protein M5K25_008380 [Dendrobium thyrsiflorum]|uniref:Uncharacterized protein n=1 Tax=Dendrobium thyrsiflorum TaxID=117978 RepID=A0ABD0V7V6_DENTH
MFKYKGIIIEGDNSNIIKVLQKADSAITANLVDHLVFVISITSFLILADLCANYALFSSFIWEDVSVNKVPPYFMSLLKEESSSFGKLNRRIYVDHKENNIITVTLENNYNKLKQFWWQENAGTLNQNLDWRKE